MTSRERAETLVRYWAPDSCASMAVDIKRAIDLAVTEEREECAKVAREYGDRFLDHSRDHAEAGDVEASRQCVRVYSACHSVSTEIRMRGAK